MIRRIAAFVIGTVLMTTVPATRGHTLGISSKVSPDCVVNILATADVLASEARARSPTCCPHFRSYCWRLA
jgi:hypothetical protein